MCVVVDIWKGWYWTAGEGGIWFVWGLFVAFWKMVCISIVGLEERERKVFCLMKMKERESFDALGCLWLCESVSRCTDPVPLSRSHESLESTFESVR